jgi:hypothetical protein
MSRTLYVYSTYEQARYHFTEFLRLHDSNNILASVSPSRLQTEINSNTYEFTWLDGINNKILGRTFSDIIVDELVMLTPEQHSLLLSRQRRHLG